MNCPIHTVYNQWTQFEEFPRFMAGVKEVRQLDDTHVHWHAEILGKDADRTRVRLVITYEPEGAIENIGDAVGALSCGPEPTRARRVRLVPKQ